MNDKQSFLTHVPPMGIYETLYAFQSAFGVYMGEKDTHPWSQGFPLTTQIPGGPSIPDAVKISSDDLKYPKAWGQPELRQKIADYYNKYYGSSIDMENIMIFAGGRPGLIALLMFLKPDVQINIASTEYTPYYDMLRILKRKYNLVESSVDNQFKPSIIDYLQSNIGGKKMVLLSNPCNPTGITRSGKELKDLVQQSSKYPFGLLVDEAYELFHEKPISAIEYIDDINKSNLFIAGAATKGLQAPGIRIGWVVAAKSYIDILGNFSSIGMGGVSRPSQLYALKLFDDDRIELAREAIPKFYSYQRDRYAQKFIEIGLELYSGSGGFYHWCKLKGEMNSSELNERLFKQGAAILKGTDCDMERLEEKSPLNQFFRFSFGPLSPDTFDNDIKIMEKSLK